VIKIDYVRNVILLSLSSRDAAHCGYYRTWEMTYGLLNSAVILMTFGDLQGLFNN